MMNPAADAAANQVGQGGEMRSSIDGEFEGWDGDTVVKLMNGQVWQQTGYYYHYHYSYMPSVSIFETETGHKMIVDGVPKAVGVKRLK